MTDFFGTVFMVVVLTVLSQVALRNGYDKIDVILIILIVMFANSTADRVGGR